MNPFFSISALLDWGFSDYDAPLPKEAPFLSAEACQSCHGEIVEQWKHSRHAQAWTNPLFQEGYIAEPDPTCIYCHAPHKEQWREIQKNEAWVHSMHPEKGSILLHPTKYPEPKAEEGINCATCHVRFGKMIASEANPKARHPIIVDPRLKTSEFCKDCHDFPILERSNGHLQLSQTWMQTTYQEWQDWSQKGGELQCQGCHMPKGSHEFHGANYRPLLHDAIQVSIQNNNENAEFTISTSNVGHHVPSGDLFRHLTLEIQQDTEWVEIAYIGRKFELVWEETQFVKRLIEDTALRPDVPQHYSIPWKNDTQWRLVYHYGSKVDEGRALLPSSVLLEVVAEGTL